MYSTFNLKNFNISQDKNNSLYMSYYRNGKELFDIQKNIITKEIDDYFNSDGVLEAEKIMADWFPEIKADIFLSHSHADEQDAITLAGLLEYELGLKTFIDSTVWGYSNDLLKKFDDKYCASESGDTYNVSVRPSHLDSGFL